MENKNWPHLNCKPANMMHIQIPKPCHEDWNAMTPEGNGRFCGSCAKTVVDFTQMSDAEVQNYFLQRSSEKLCGRFTRSQLKRITIEIPAATLQMRLPVWKRFLVASLLAFSTLLFSCDATVKQPPPATEATGTAGVTTPDTGNVTETPHLLGDTSVPLPPPPLKTCTITNIVTDGMVVGDIALPPEPPLMGVPVLDPPIQDTIPMPNTHILTGEPAVIIIDSAAKKKIKDTVKPNLVTDSTIISHP
jgi:hypothetical protein